MPKTRRTTIDLWPARLPDDCSAAALRRAARAALAAADAPPAQISIAIVDDRDMTRLNRRYLERSGTTDVLSFDLSEPDLGVGDATAQIIVNLDEARRQASARGHSVEGEAALYVVHGVLHLVGYDDSRPAAARRMHAEEDRIMMALGYGTVYSGRGRRGSSPGV